MWTDLMRRWMEMAFWWLPGQGDDRPAEHDRRGAPPPRAEARPPSAQATPTPAPAAAPAAEPAGTAPAKSAAAATGGADLTGIKGIGPAMQRRLADAGINNRAELAAADADALAERLKAGKAVVSRAQVAAWIKAAGG